MKKIRVRELNFLHSALILAAVSLLTELLSLYIQPWAFRRTLYEIVTRPALIFLNLFPVVIFVLIGYFITKNVFWGAAPAALVFPLMSYVNLLKIEGRDDAFVPADIGLIREALESASGYSLNLHLWLVAVIILYTAALVLLGFVFKSPDIRPLVRAGAGIVTLAAFLLSARFVYADKKLYESFTVEEMYNIPFVFNTLGFNYCFLHNLNLYPIDKPDGFDKREVEQWIAQYSSDARGDTVNPNIIFVMGEAFSDITNSDVFDYENDEQNPIHRFNQLAASERAVSGHIAVSNFGAGTANTEFDILTGTPTNMISGATTSSFRVVHRKTPTIANLFIDIGYNSYFMHPGSNWFYNRSSVYSYFGINDQVFEDSFDLSKDKKGNMISDASFLRQLKGDIESRRKAPQFMYTVTLQNHLTYNYAKYGYEPELLPLKTGISDRAREYLSVYCEGVRDTSDMIYELAQYLDRVSEPTLLVFFGDHLPNLGEDFLTYRELGMDIGRSDSLESRLSTYETPFLIYANTAYCEKTDFAKAKESSSLDGSTISDFYLGAAVCEIAGFEGYDPYVDFLNESRRRLPVLRDNEEIFMLPGGELVSSVDGELSEIVHKIDWWQYYRLKY